MAACLYDCVSHWPVCLNGCMFVCFSVCTGCVYAHMYLCMEIDRVRYAYGSIRFIFIWTKSSLKAALPRLAMDRHTCIYVWN